MQFDSETQDSHVVNTGEEKHDDLIDLNSQKKVEEDTMSIVSSPQCLTVKQGLICNDCDMISQIGKEMGQDQKDYINLIVSPFQVKCKNCDQ